MGFLALVAKNIHSSILHFEHLHICKKMSYWFKINLLSVLTSCRNQHVWFTIPGFWVPWTEQIRKDLPFTEKQYFVISLMSKLVHYFLVLHAAHRLHVFLFYQQKVDKQLRKRKTCVVERLGSLNPYTVVAVAMYACPSCMKWCVLITVQRSGFTKAPISSMSMPLIG